MLGFSVCCEVVNGSCPPLALLTVPSQEKGKEWLAAHSANCTTRSLYLSEAELSGAPPRKLVISCPAEEGRAGCGGRQITTCRRSLRKKEGRREGEEAEKDGRWERRGLAARGAVADLEGSSGSPWRLTLLQTNRFYLFILIISSLLFFYLLLFANDLATTRKRDSVWFFRCTAASLTLSFQPPKALKKNKHSHYLKGNLESTKVKSRILKSIKVCHEILLCYVMLLCYASKMV